MQVGAPGSRYFLVMDCVLNSHCSGSVTSWYRYGHPYHEITDTYLHILLCPSVAFKFQDAKKFTIFFTIKFCKSLFAQHRATVLVVTNLGPERNEIELLVPVPYYPSPPGTTVRYLLPMHEK
jgi:hypothetical protein